ncbi:MAG: cytochrome c-type biogenesis protein CcmH [Chloroflexi bacterium]|nr:cytochrome c-type biogenesis protein CcmH [Chloroflexota bacterium]
MKLIMVSLFSLLVFLTLATPVYADAVTVDGIANQLICQCGCYMVLNNCTHQECSSRETMLAAIKVKVDQGESAEAIVQSFVRGYGEKVLSEPPKRGFNLTAWISPFAGLLVGAAVVYLLVKKWVRRGVQSTANVTDSEEQDEEYRQRLERELREYSEKGFR